MTNYLWALSILFLITSCDAPRRTRAPVQYSGMNQSNTSSNGFTQNNIPGGQTNSPSYSQGFENCNLSYQYHTIDIGHFGLCQSSLDKSAFKFLPSLSSNQTRTCLIPTYKDGSGASTYLGNPQCTYTTANQAVQGYLQKTRSGYEQYPINGVIVMKEPLLTEYFNCMHASLNWPGNICPTAINPYCQQALQYCPNGANTSPACQAQAQNYMSSVCTAFKSKYSNAYISISL